jgi:alcohol dehydrogenase
MLAEVEAGVLAPQRLITHRIGLDDAAAALATLDTRPGDGITLIATGSSATSTR